MFIISFQTFWHRIRGKRLPEIGKKTPASQKLNFRNSSVAQLINIINP